MNELYLCRGCNQPLNYGEITKHARGCQKLKQYRQRLREDSDPVLKSKRMRERTIRVLEAHGYIATKTDNRTVPKRLSDAIEILNRNRHFGSNTWDKRAVGDGWIAVIAGGRNWITHDGAIAVAMDYVRTGK